MKKHMISRKGNVHIKGNGTLKQGRSSMLRLQRYEHHQMPGDVHMHEEVRHHDTNLERLRESLAGMSIGRTSGKKYVKF